MGRCYTGSSRSHKNAAPPVHLPRAKNGTKLLSLTNADTHMLLGHDVYGASIRHSPFVSTTENVQELLKTDSPYNQEGGNCGRFSANTQQEASRFKNFKLPKQEAQYYSDRIAILTHGQSSYNPTIPVATHIAFLVVPLHRLYYPPTTASAVSCCRLENEVTIFAPRCRFGSLDGRGSNERFTRANRTWATHGYGESFCGGRSYFRQALISPPGLFPIRYPILRAVEANSGFPEGGGLAGQ